MNQRIENLLNYDPIASVERILDKPSSQFNTSDGLFAMLDAMEHNRRKQFALQASGDTYFNMSWIRLHEILDIHKFILGTYWTFVNNTLPGKEYKEEAVIYYRLDGIIIFAESSNNQQSVNGGTCFYELSRKPGVSISDFYNLISTGGCHDDGARLHNQLDIREGLIHNLRKAQEIGDFVPCWTGTKSLWITDFVESRTRIPRDGGFDARGKAYEELTLAHLRKCPKELLSIIQNLYPSEKLFS